jgi:hypothetical protein
MHEERTGKQTPEWNWVTDGRKATANGYSAGQADGCLRTVGSPLDFELDLDRSSSRIDRSTRSIGPMQKSDVHFPT